jgi:hypothetical protein
MLAEQIVIVQDGGWQQTAIAIGTCVAALGFVAAAVGTFLAWFGIKENSKGRHAQLAIDFGKRWDNRHMANVRQITEDFDPGHLRAYYQVKLDTGGVALAQLEAFANFFEDLGVLNKLAIIDIVWIDETLGAAVRDYWDMWAVAAFDLRTRNRKVYQNWEALAEKIRERRTLNLD